MGSCKSVACDTEARKISDWAIERKHFFNCHSHYWDFECRANVESREAKTRTERKLNHSSFSKMLKHLKLKPVKDLFSSRIYN